MRSLALSIFLLLASAFTFAQGHDFIANGGVIARTGAKLIAPNSGLTLCSDTVNFNNAPSGSFSFVTPTLASGTFQAGGVFNGGGSVTITANGPYCENFSGTFQAGATWQLVTLANGTHQYVLSGTFASGKGAFVLLTNNIGKGFFNGAEGIAYASIHLVQ